MYAESGKHPARPTATPAHTPALAVQQGPFLLACQALERVGMALVIVDAEGALRAANKLATQSMGDLLTQEDGGLKAASLSATRRLRQALAAATCAAAPTATMIYLTGADSGRDGVEPVPVLVAPVEPSPGLCSAARLAMLIFAASEDPAELEARLRQAYGLTPAEGRLLAALVNGMHPADYAAASHIEVSTVKSHLRGLLAKTGEKRQAGLVRRALTEQRLRPDIQPDSRAAHRRQPPPAREARTPPA